MPKLRNGSTGDSNQGSIAGPEFYRWAIALHSKMNHDIMCLQYSNPIRCTHLDAVRFYPVRRSDAELHHSVATDHVPHYDRRVGRTADHLIEQRVIESRRHRLSVWHYLCEKLKPIIAYVTSELTI